MAGNLAIMARDTVAIGPTGRRLAANVFALRKARGLNQPQLASRLQDQGRAVHATVVSKIEQLDRRVDIDDLIALAIALDTTPNRLLLADARPGKVVLRDEADTEGMPVTTFAADSVELTPELSVPLLDAWAWADGDAPLPAESALPEAIAEERHSTFQGENRPHAPVRRYFDKTEVRKHPELIGQAAALVRAARQAGVGLGLLHDFLELAAVTAVNGESANPQGTQ